MEIRILMEDRYLTVCMKPVGISSEDGGMPNLLQSAHGGHRFYTVHRLDRDAGGVMVYAKDGRTAALLSEMFAARKTVKEYLAVVHGVPDPAEGGMRDLLFHDSSRNKTFVVKRMRKGVREAELTYRTVWAGTGDAPLSLVSVKLGTGRSHQIRVQFASRKMPLYGDTRYGSPVRNAAPALWSYRLAFEHPVTGEALSFAELPEGAVWEPFFANITTDSLRVSDDVIQSGYSNKKEAE